MKYIYRFIFFIFVLFILFYFFYFRSNFKSVHTRSQEDFFRGSVNTEKKKMQARSRERSLFEADSKFLEFPIVGIEDEDSSDLTPIEKERRRKIIIEKTKKLADMFPHNSVIPRELTLEEAKKVAETNQKMATIQNNFLQNEVVSKEDKIFYYKERLRTSKDRLEIFRYALGLQNAGNFDESKLEDFLKERYNAMLESEKAYADEIVKLEKE